jgi:uncharacterized membrane protein YdjX (TVP38/TMEM64 family)
MGALWSTILVMLFSILPIPAEVVMFRNMHTYGFLFGALVNWSGALLGAEVLFIFTRVVRISLTRFSRTSGSYSYRLIEKQRTKLQRVMVLILVRILPVPAKIVDLTAGIIRTISWWEFTWTTGVGMIPYQLFMMLVYRGWQTRSVYIWLFVAIVIICCFVIFLRMKKREG